MSPFKIGFIFSLVTHLALIAIILNIYNNKISIKTDNNKVMSINLSNVQSPNPPSSHKQKQEPKKKKPKKKKIVKNEALKAVEQLQEETPEDSPQEIIQEEIGKSKEEIEEQIPESGGGMQTLSEDNKLFAMIKEAIDKNNRYPKMAKRRNIQGDVLVEFVLLTNGKIKDIKAINDSNRILEKGAIEAIERSYKEFPRMLHNTKIRITISYNLI